MDDRAEAARVRSACEKLACREKHSGTWVELMMIAGMVVYGVLKAIIPLNALRGPYWGAVFVFLAGSPMFLWMRLRAPRYLADELRKRGRCTFSGYLLDSGTEVCPECGTVPPADAE